jgi:hypothetical protein
VLDTTGTGVGVNRTVLAEAERGVLLADKA